MTVAPTLRPLGGGLHALAGEVRVGPGFRMPLHSTVVELSRGGLAIVAPPAIDDALAERLEAMGAVRHLIAPNRLHHGFIAAASARWPEARVHAAEGVAERHPELRVDEVLPARPGADAGTLPDELHPLAIAGAPDIAETVLLHPASATLIATDLVFHVLEPTGWLAPLILRVVGAHRRLGQSRYWRFAVKDRGALAASFRAILDRDFERLVVAHGPAVLRDARAALLPLLRWALDAPASAAGPASEATGPPPGGPATDG